MSRPLPRSRIWVDPQDFKDLRRQAGLTRKQTAEALDVTGHTIQNWETGGARIPWVAYQMLRILRGYALPGKDWEGWTITGETSGSLKSFIFGTFSTHSGRSWFLRGFSQYFISGEDRFC